MTKSVNSATAGAAAVPRREPGTAKRLVARTDNRHSSATRAPEPCPLRTINASHHLCLWGNLEVSELPAAASATRLRHFVRFQDGHTFGAPISVRGRATPGDVWELNVEDQAERDQGKVLPEDEGVVVREDPRQ